MNRKDLDNGKIKPEGQNGDHSDLLEKIENAYRIYKLSEMYFNDVTDDYGKLKIARLRLDFARHELVALLEEAKRKGVEWKDNEMIKSFLHPQ